MLLVLPVVLLLLAGCGRGGTVQEGEVADSSAEKGPPVGDFYKRYEGTIAGRNVVVHLHRYGHEVRGSYQYLSAGRPVTISNWEDTTDDQTLFLSELIREEDTADQQGPHWSLELTGSGATGTWSSGDEATTYHIVLHESYPEGSYRLDALTYTDTARLFASRSQPHAYVDYGVVAPANDWQGPDRDFIASAISRLLDFDRPAGNANFREGLGTQAQRYFDQYREDLHGLVDSNATAEVLESFIYEYYATEHLYVVYNAKGWLVLEDVTGEYTGGAHGNYGSSYLNLDITGKKAWAIGEIIGDTLGLGAQLEAAAREYFRLQPGQDIGDRLLVKEIRPTRNFYLTPTGITFVYNPYEIASYADGEVDLFLPYRRLMPLLTQEFRRRMGLQERSGVAML